MLLIPYLLTVLYSLIRKKNNKYLWLWIALLLSMMSVTSKTYADVDGYTQVFELANSASSIFLIPDWPVLWLGICKICGMCGLNYRGMIVVILFISTYLFHRYAKELCKNENYYWGLFLLFPALVQIVQLRFFLATAILVHGFKYLIDRENRWLVKFVAIGVLATMVHSSCIIFVTFLGIIYLKNLDTKKIISITLIGVIGIFYFLNYIPLLASKFIDTARMSRYFYEGSTAMSSLGLFKVILVWLGGIFLVLFCMKFSKGRYNHCNEFEKNYDSFSLYIMCWCGICIPLMCFDENFFRILEFGFIGAYVSVANCIFSSYKRKKYHSMRYVSIETVCVILISSFLLALATYTYAPKESVINPLFRYDGIERIIK